MSYQGPRQPLDCSNLKSFRDKSDIGLQKVNKEIQLGRIAGPFQNRPPGLENLRCSPLGLVPKREVNSYRLIQHLGFPPKAGVNDFIPKECTKVSYMHFDKALECVAKCGEGALMAKCDIKSAFRLLPVHRSDIELLGMLINGSYYVDLVLPMGCSISCSLFEKFSTFLHWRLQNLTKITTICHYIDDFAFFGRPNTNESQRLLSEFRALCEHIGVPLAHDKTVHPSTCMEYLGLEIDSIAGQVRAPKEKVDRAVHRINYILSHSAVSLKSLQSLAGLLSFLCRPIPSGRAFLRRLFEAIPGGNTAGGHMIPITRDIREDLTVWLDFLMHYNGVSLIGDIDWTSSEAIQLYTDASGFGFGLYFQGSWAQGRFPPQWLGRSMAFKEFFPIFVALLVWKDRLRNKRVVFNTDNKAVMCILNKKSSTCPLIMKLLRNFVLTCMRANIHIKSTYVNTKLNDIADALSRFQNHRFRTIAPGADELPTSIPSHLYEL